MRSVRPFRLGDSEIVIIALGGFYVEKVCPFSSADRLRVHIVAAALHGS